ncbi:protoporphyrinogen oxidase HemJ [Dongia soli]|uniref:Protoporphyrinogen IX oxidase n=1 Tax=Dongia soli TaxID=600628 RepID=A0ABU5E8B0_9PROT|nr:protoporphyrinogen oxidase HemJ [Dongia soli]MDY0881979.1 protoporphyrinogen oxidase HemJ [Dongia soli]
MDLYSWVKAAHIISVIAWMAGMLYLPRLYVYHADAKPGSELSETFKVMERRLLRGIINPAMLATWVFGLWLAYLGDDWREGWLHGKLTLVILMQITHAAYARWRKKFAEDANTNSAKFYRVMNEVPTVLMIGIVILVVLKPF